MVSCCGECSAKKQRLIEGRLFQEADQKVSLCVERDQIACAEHAPENFKTSRVEDNVTSSCQIYLKQ